MLQAYSCVYYDSKLVSHSPDAQEEKDRNQLAGWGVQKYAIGYSHKGVEWLSSSFGTVPTKVESVWQTGQKERRNNGQERYGQVVHFK